MTKKACVIGWPINHSRSPTIHGYWLKKYAIAGTYEKVAVEPEGLGKFLTELEENGYAGCNITIPHKQTCLDFVTIEDEPTRKIGAINTVFIEKGVLKGLNTDGMGFISNIRQSLPNWQLANKKISIIGAGGATRAIVASLLENSIETIRIFNRTVAKAEIIATDFRSRVSAHSITDITDYLPQTDFLINTSSLGMTGQPPLEIDLTGMEKTSVVSDIVYSPLETSLLRQAKNLKLQTVGGLGMLLHQAAPGFEKWFGHKPTVTSELYDLVVKDLEQK